MYLVFDLETTSKEEKKRKGNPFYNSILCIGLKYQNKDISNLLNEIGSGKLFSVSKDLKNLFCVQQDYMPKGWLDGVDMLIGHHLKYDLLYTWRNDELQNYFKSGGRIWDTQLAEYILSGQQHKYPALRDISVTKYGCRERVKNLEQYKVNGKLDTTLIPIEELLEDVRGDVLDTEQVALQQVKLAKKNGMYNLIKIQMDFLLATTEMEYNGMYVNKEILNRNKTNLEEELEKTKKGLLILTEKHWL